jgi:LacI family transcriptional regulator
MTSHLLDLGHRAIGFIRGRPEHGATEQRYLGFTDEMRARGVPVKSQWVHTGNFIFMDGLACAERMLRGPSRPTAVFASNDDMAAAVISAARQRGLELPRQLSVVGFDDAPVATMVWPQLTTIRQPVREMARAATELIIRHSPRRRGWPQPIPRRRLNFELILRNSTAPPLP